MMIMFYHCLSDDDNNNDNNRNHNHNYNKIVKSDWLSTALISALIGQYAPSRARLNGFFFHC